MCLGLTLDIARLRSPPGEQSRKGHLYQYSLCHGCQVGRMVGEKAQGRKLIRKLICTVLGLILDIARLWSPPGEQSRKGHLYQYSLCNDFDNHESGFICIVSTSYEKPKNQDEQLLIETLLCRPVLNTSCLHLDPFAFCPIRNQTH